MKKIILVTIMAICFMVTPTFASNNNQAAIQSVREATAMQFCGFVAEKVLRSGGKTFVLYSTAGTPYEDNGLTRCSTGSGTGLVHLAQLDSNGHIVSADIFENFGFINQRFIDTDSFLLSNGVLIFRNYEFGKDPITGENDPNCCASDMYLNSIQLSNMRLINRKFIGRARR